MGVVVLRGAGAWTEKLKRYHALGVDELVRFDPEPPDGARLRVWDRVEGDLVERDVERDVNECAVLGLWRVVCPAAGLDGALKLSRAPQGGDLLPDGQEAEARARKTEAAARRAAERRIAELEEELRKRG